MRRFFTLGFASLFFLLMNIILGACSQAASVDEVNDETPLSTVQARDKIIKTIMVSSIIPSPTRKPTLTAVPKRIQETPEPVNVQSNIGTATKHSSTTELIIPTKIHIELFQICSPLSIVEISDLSKIISCPYNPPPMGKDDRHQGVDFSYHHWKGSGPIHGVGVRAVMPGVVVASLISTFPYGNLVLIETSGESIPLDLYESLGITTGKSIYTMYAHLDGRPWVKLGQQVMPCQILGLVGSSGNSVVPHLHLETRIGPAGTVFLGLSRFREETTVLEKENYLLWRTSGKYIHFDPMNLFEYKLNK